MKPKTKYQIIKSNWKGFWVCIAIAVCAPIAMSLPFARPESEPFEFWFQRAGSITVIFALLAEMYALKISHVFDVSEGLDQELFELPKHLKAPEKLYTGTVFVVAVVGTIIWGYGDFIKKIHNKAVLSQRKKRAAGTPSLALRRPKPQR